MILKEDLKLAVLEAFITIDNQKAYIEELEKKVDDLQKSLDAVLQNKCRVRKVKVKVYGRGKVDKGLPRTF